MFVQVIDTALSYHITSAFFNNPLVFQALQSMNENIPPAFHSCLSDWQVTGGVLTYKGHIYVSNDDNLCHTIPLHHHDHKTAGHPSSLKTCQLVVAESGGLAWPHISANMLKGVPPVNKTKQTHTQLYLPSPQLNHPPVLAPFNRSPAILSPPFLLSCPLTLSWSWLTMGLLRK